MALIHAQAGDLRFAFDPDLGMLRYVRLGATEVIRGVYTAVRDEHWGTYPRQIRDLVVEEGRITWIDESGPVRWQGSIQYDENQVRFEVDGVGLRDFETQRTGLCLLHPSTAAGASISVTHTDGAVTESHLPDLISPHQPFFDIRSMTTNQSAVTTEVTFEGEIFEMEDQRNWSDASFKTYCRPHHWPRPYPVAEGERVCHAVTVRVTGMPTPAINGPVEITVLPEECQIPDWTPLVRFAEGFEETLAPGTDAMVVGGSLASLRSHELASLNRLILTDPAHLDALRPEAETIPLWFGTDHNFTDLNRSEVDRTGLRGLSFATHAQVHAFDDRSIAETLQGLEDVLRSAVAFAQGLPVHVGPIRFGPIAGHEALQPVWSLALVQILAEAGIPTAHFSDPQVLEGYPVTGKVHQVVSQDPIRARAYSREEGTYLLSLDPEGVTVQFGGQTLALAPFEVRFIPA